MPATPGRRTIAVLVALTVGLPLVAPAANAAELEWPARLFTLARSNPFPDAVQDVAETSEGRLLFASGGLSSRRGGLISELGPDGTVTRRTSFPPGAGLAGIGLLAEPDGTVLAADGWGSRIVRLREGGARVPVAGNGTRGFSGDGGPAVQAALDFGAQELIGLAPMGDGSIAFSDAWNNRIRRIRPDGVIETIAGIGPSMSTQFSPNCHELGGDGGPATRATLCKPSDLLALADGSLLVADGEHFRIRRIAPDGTISSFGGALPHVPTSLASLPDGDILVGHFSGISRMSAGGEDYRPFLTFETFEGGTNSFMVDFGGRGIGGARPVTGLLVTREGGIAFAAQNLYYLAPRRSGRTLVNVRDGRAGAERVALEILATRPGRATLTVARGERTVAEAGARVRAGRARVAVDGRFAPRAYDVGIRLTGRDGGAADDTMRLYLGGRLRVADARRYVRGQLDEDSSIGACARLAPRRVDCWLQPGSAPDGCFVTTAVRLRRTGHVWSRSYRCRPDARVVRRDPPWIGEGGRVGLG